MCNGQCTCGNGGSGEQQDDKKDNPLPAASFMSFCGSVPVSALMGITLGKCRGGTFTERA